MDNLIESSGISEKYTSTGTCSGYQVDLYHSGLDEHKHLSAVEHSALSGKIHNQTTAWQAKWEKELSKKAWQSKEEDAIERTAEAQAKIQDIENILEHTTHVNDIIVGLTQA